MKRIDRFLATFAFLGLTMAARADVVVITDRNSPLPELSVTLVSDLYLGRMRSLPDGRPVIVIERELDSHLRERFFHLLNGMSLKQINAYWARLQFSGRVLPPPRLADSRSLLKVIHSSPAAIGYIDEAEVDDSVRVVLRLADVD